jgi:predicted O-methyltransferase YrrM
MTRIARPRAQSIIHALTALVANPLVAGRALPGEIRQRHGSAQYADSDVDAAWYERLHVLLGAPWPCPVQEGLATELAELGARLARWGMRPGRSTYGYYSDADAALCGAIWCAVVHTRPRVVIETGVAHGVSSQLILAALAQNDRGHLWSIDLPHPLRTGLHAQTAIAVADHHKSRWSYIEGPSRQRLPAVLAEVGQVGLFIHDSLHTARNTLFEMERAATVMEPRGVMLIDDIFEHGGFATFARRHPDYHTLICQPSDNLGVFGIAIKAEASEPARAGL